MLDLRTKKQKAVGMMNVQEFANSHKNYLVIVADPSDDTMFMAYKGKQVKSRIAEAGKTTNIIKNMLKGTDFGGSIDRFLAGMALATKISITKGSNFYFWVDGAIYNIMKALKGGNKKTN